LLLTYYLQVVLRWSPVRTGMAFLPLTAAVALSAGGIASRLLPRVRPRTLIVPGMLASAAGLALLTRLTPGSGYLSLILPAEILLGAGLGCVFTPAISVATIKRAAVCVATQVMVASGRHRLSIRARRR
jgi:hypothetical protein